MPPDHDVVVVGSGPAGLSAAGALSRLGVAAVVLERDDEIGARWARRYDRLRLHTARRFSGLAHYPLPKTLPRYVTKDEFAAYLRDYAAHFELDVRPSQEVTAIRPRHGAWAVETTADTWQARVVVVATGKYDRPVLPDWPGRDLYRGPVLHASGYRSGADYRGQDVLVVGLGNTGAEIAADLLESGARRVAVAMRTPPPITRRDIAGVPVQILGIAGSVLPASVGDRLGSALRKIGTGDLSGYGIGPAAWGPFTARRPPVIDVGFLAQLRAGRVDVLPAVDRLTEDAVVLTDGRRERFDAVIAATGYRSSLADLLDLDPAHPDALPAGVHAVGFRETIRGALFEMRRDSLALAQTIAAELRSSRQLLPS
jgi:cation diffusion facilitator CzcD-associated flavoprotein CzcO